MPPLRLVLVYGLECSYGDQLCYALINLIRSLQLRKEGTTKADVARELDLHPQDLDRLVFNLALVPIDVDDMGIQRGDSPAIERNLRLVKPSRDETFAANARRVLAGDDSAAS